MNIYYWVLLIIGILYGGLTVLAGVSQFKHQKIHITSNLAMIFGAVLVVIISVKINIFSWYTVYILILGLPFIHISAINNGLNMHGKLNIRHHLMRSIVTIVIIILFFLRG